MKSILSKLHITVLCIALLASLMGAFSVSAADVSPKELIANGGFEDIGKDGIPTGDWQAYKGWDGGYVSLEKNMVYAGKYSIKIENKTGSVALPFYRFMMKDVKPGAVYTISAMASYNIEASGGSFMLLAESYSDDVVTDKETYIGSESHGNVTGNSNDKWVEMSGTFTAPDNCKLLVIYCYFTASGTVYVDNVSMKSSGGPKPYSYTTDNVFYHPDDKTGSAYVKIDPYYKNTDDLYNGTVDFAFLDGDKVLDSKKNVKLVNGKAAEYVYDMSLLSVMEKKYNIKAVLKGKNGKVIETDSSEVYKYKRPTMLLADGTYIKDGEPYYPSIAYWPISDYAKMKEAGINCVELGASSVEQTVQALDQLQALGMTALVSLFCGPAWMQPAGHPQNIDLTKELVKAVKNHPAVFAYATMDEPLGSGITEEMVRAMITSYQIVREIDKNHPIYVVDWNPKLYKESQKYCDIFSGDVYTVGNTSIITDDCKAAVVAVAGRKPAYWITQTYKNSDYGLPIIKDVRGCVYRAFESGIKGIGYYSILKAIGQFGGETPVDLPDTPLWEPMTKFAQNEQKELFDYFVGKKYRTFNKHEDGENKSLFYESWVHGNDIWLIVHNRGNDTIDAIVPLTSDNGLVKVKSATAKAIGGTQADAKISDGTMSIKMGPQEVYLYKVTPMIQ